MLHELLVAVPLHTLQLYAFWGMVAQVPLIWFTKWMVRRLKQPVWSNCVFWLTFLVFGQPLLILLYSHAVLSKTPPQRRARRGHHPAAGCAVRLRMKMSPPMYDTT